MRIEHLTYIFEIAACQSISTAARKLYISQTTLSSIVHGIEEELGVKLFQRTSRGVTLTTDGEQVMPMLQDIVSRYEKVTSVCQGSATVGKNLHLITYPSLCNTISVYLADKLANQYEDLLLAFHEASQDKVIPRMLEGIGNIAIGSNGMDKFNAQKRLATSNGFPIEQIYTDRFYLLVNSRSPYAARQEVDIAELKNERRATAHFFPDPVNSHFGRAFAKVKRTTIFTGNDIIKLAVAQTDMIAFMTGLSLYQDPYITSGQLKMIPLTGFEEENVLITYLAHRKHAELSLAEKFLLSEIKSFFAALGKVV